MHGPGAACRRFGRPSWHAGAASDGRCRTGPQALVHSPARLPVTSWVVRSTGWPPSVLVMVLPRVSVSAVKLPATAISDVPLPDVQPLVATTLPWAIRLAL